MIAQLSPATAQTSNYQQFLNALKASGFRGEISADYASRVVLATDNSIYQRLPQAAVFPMDADDVAKVAGKERSFLGLEEPLFTLKNPGIISIPLGFLAVLLGSLLFRDRRSEELWPEVYARQNTGILASKAAAH